MTYNQLAKETEQLNYRDKLRLAQLLIQRARKEEEEQNPAKRAADVSNPKPDSEQIRFVAERLRKLKPSKKEAVLNSIAAMYQFRGGISDVDQESIFSELQKRRHIVVGGNGRVEYPAVEQGHTAEAR